MLQHPRSDNQGKSAQSIQSVKKESRNGLTKSFLETANLLLELKSFQERMYSQTRLLRTRL